MAEITNRDKQVRGKLEVHCGLVAKIATSLPLWASQNPCQCHHCNDRLTRHIALEWNAQDVEINQLLNQRGPAASNILPLL